MSESLEERLLLDERDACTDKVVDSPINHLLSNSSHRRAGSARHTANTALLRVAGRANLDRRDACRLGGSENHIDDGDATMADPAARNCCRALIAGSPYPTSALPDLVSAAKCYIFWKNTTNVQFFYFFISQVADSVPQRIL